ncbi:MAG: carbohydrate ABC transporter permease, partial [Acidimicrobiia bacterium]|nr:carbohydrate ABC transporter permease [Acidimicrobiia bacterium]
MTAAAPEPTRLQRIMKAAPVRIAVLVMIFFWTIPTFGVLVSSFRSPDDIDSTGWWTVFTNPFDPSQWTLGNYADVITDDGMGDAFINSIIVAVPATILPITIAAFAAYAFAWMDFPGRGLLFALVIALLVVPLQMTLIPILELYGNLELSGTFLGLWLAHTGFGLPLAVYLLYSYISQLPKDMLEAAFVDGASHYDAFVKLVIPLSMPAIASFAIFQFLWVWNDLLVALVFNQRNPVVTVELSELVGSKGQDWHLLTAGEIHSIVEHHNVVLALQAIYGLGREDGSGEGEPPETHTPTS